MKKISIVVLIFLFCLAPSVSAQNTSKTKLSIARITPAFYKGPNKVSSVTCGETYIFTVSGLSSYPGQVWLEQTKNGSSKHKDVITVPNTYTSACNQDEGKYLNTIYSMVDGKKGILLGKTSFTINPLPKQSSTNKLAAPESKPTTTRYTCSLSFSKLNINPGDTVSWTVTSSPTGLSAYWYGTKRVGGKTTNDVNGLLAGTTNFTQSYTYQASEVGNYTRYLILKDSSGKKVCETNKVRPKVTELVLETISSSSDADIFASTIQAMITTFQSLFKELNLLK